VEFAKEGEDALAMRAARRFARRGSRNTLRPETEEEADAQERLVGGGT
jgi:hypothetical protein